MSSGGGASKRRRGGSTALAERRRLLRRLIDAVYVDARGAKAIVRIKAKAAFRAILPVSSPVAEALIAAG